MTKLVELIRKSLAVVGVVIAVNKALTVLADELEKNQPKKNIDAAKN